MTKELDALNAGNRMDFWGNQQPKCPHCGHDYDISRNDAWELYNDDETHEVDCLNCELAFQVRTITQHTFCTDEQEDA